MPLKGSDLVSCHPSSGGATSSSPCRRLAIKNQTRMETVLRWRRCWGAGGGGGSEVVEGWEVSVGRGHLEAGGDAGI